MLDFVFSVQVAHECVLSCIAYGESVSTVLAVEVGVVW